MCGIGGVFYFDAACRVPRDVLERMANALRHRGPEDEGFLQDGSLGFAHRRLAIIDRAGGRQPLTNEDASIHTICNGEIFNYQDLAVDLEKRGHVLRTRSDCEVLSHLYEEYGETFAAKLRGQFALALWDSKKKTLLLARDHVGEKPLYVYHDRDKVVFASEMKAILASGLAHLDLNWTRLGHYLQLGYFPGAETQYVQIQKLPAAHTLVVREGMRRTFAYWKMPRPSAARSGVRFEAVADELEARLLEATRIRLMSEVPLGAFLSGGVDSSLIVALMTKLSTSPPKTFSISFKEGDFDESWFARRVAERLKTDHYEIPVDYQIEGLIEKVLRHFDEPFADSSAIPQYLVCQAAKRHVTVALSGDAGDEFFGGYQRFLARKLAGYFMHLPRALRAGLNNILNARPSSRAARFVRLSHYYEENPAMSALPFFNSAEQRALLGAELFEKQVPDQSLAEIYGAATVTDAAEMVARHLYLDQNSYLTDDILVKVDRMSMIHALEVRSPLLDCRLIEWVAGLPLDLKLKGLQTKVALKRLAARYVPREAVYRRKQGFAVPLPHWFRNQLRNFVSDELHGPGLSFLDQGFMTRMLEEHQSGRRDWSQQLWALLSLRYTFKT